MSVHQKEEKSAATSKASTASGEIKCQEKINIAAR